MWPTFNIVMRIVSSLIGIAMILMSTVWMLQGLNLAFRVGTIQELTDCTSSASRRRSPAARIADLPSALMINDHNGIPFAPPIDAAAVDIFIASRDNPLLKFAKPVLLLAAPLRHLAAGADVKALRRYAIQEIRAFEEHARQCALLHDDISEASWALCALLDEAVFNSSSSANTDWYFQSLLITIHLELRSEIKFFDVLDRLLTDPRHHLQLLEHWYLCIALGYVGKYRSDPGGAPALTAIRSDLYQRIQSLRQLT